MGLLDALKKQVDILQGTRPWAKRGDRDDEQDPIQGGSLNRDPGVSPPDVMDPGVSPPDTMDPDVSPGDR
jgi:hypothetical protein